MECAEGKALDFAYCTCNSMSPRRIGVTIRKLREAQGLTQERLAKKARVSQPYLSQLESGRSKKPGIAIIQKLARALGVPVGELLE